MDQLAPGAGGRQLCAGEVTATDDLVGKPPGFWIFLHDPEAGSYMHFLCPCGCGDRDCVPVAREGAKPHWHPDYWTWNGDEARPTLAPSLGRRTPCKFHGHLVSGVWSACPGSASVVPDVHRPSRVTA